MRRRRRYLLTVENEARLESVFRYSFSPFVFWLSVSVLLLGCFCVSAAIVVFSPLKNILPGYGLRDKDPYLYAEKIDSINSRMEANNAYVENIRCLFDTRRMPDSDTVSSSLNIISVDSIVSPSARESAFVAKIGSRARSVGAALLNDAGGYMFFQHPAKGAILEENSRGTGKAVYFIPDNSDIISICQGRVVEKYYSSSAVVPGFVIIIQSPKGYLTKYSGLPNPLTEIGDWLIAGQTISLPSDKAFSSNIAIEMWKTGDRLLPEELIRAEVPGYNTNQFE